MKTQIISPSVKNSSIRVIFSTQIKGSRDVPTHIHDEYEISLCMEGEMDYFINETAYHLNKGDILFVNKRNPHSSFSHKGSHTAVIIFGKRNILYDEKSPIYEILSPQDESCFLFKCDTPANNELKQCFLSVLKERDEKKPCFDMYIKSEIYRIFSILFRYNALTNPDNFIITPNAQRLLPAIEYINDNFEKNLLLEDVSKKVNISKTHFCKIFKESFNMSFVDYVNSIRIYNAEKLLLDSDKSVGETSELCGFSTQEYFTKTFKKSKKCTPTEYRKKKLINKHSKKDGN